MSLRGLAVELSFLVAVTCGCVGPHETDLPEEAASDDAAVYPRPGEDPSDPPVGPGCPGTGECEALEPVPPGQSPGIGGRTGRQSGTAFVAALPPDLGVPEPPELLPACEVAAEQARQRAIARMEHAMDQALARFKLAWCVKSLFKDNPECDLQLSGGIRMLSGGGQVALPPAPTGAQEYSDTNNQVDGVDEPDLVKSDGLQLFVASGKALHVVSAWPWTRIRPRPRAPGTIR